MDLRETSLGFYRAWHIALGAKHGFFLALRDAPLAPATLAGELRLDARAVEDWCRGAWALGLLSQDRKPAPRYRLRAEHRKTLGEPAAREYLGHHFEYIAAKSLAFGALDDLLRGKAPEVDLAATYAIATRWDHVASFDAIPPALRRELERGIDVLDLGAGQGSWAREAQRRFPRSRLSAADLDLEPLADLRAFDARKLPARAFDLVFLGEVLAATREPVDVLRSAHRALRPGGRLVALEGLAPEGAPRGWGPTLVLAMQLDFALDGSRYRTAREVQKALGEAGFGAIRMRDLGGSLYWIDARKPQTSRRA